MWLVGFALLIAGCCATNLGGPGVTDSRCPRGCHCYDDDLNVVCVDAGLDAVPYILHTELKRLVVPGNNFTNLLDALYTYPLLEYLDLSRNRIVALDRRPFLPLTSLTHLDLSQNRLARLQEDSFIGLRSLQVLNLSHNHLDSISPLVVGSLVNLKEIYLGNNRLSNLFSGFFDALPGLTTLDLSRNLFGSVLGPPGEKTWRVVELNLEGNPLEVLEANAFRGMRELKRLSLKECDLTGIDDLAFNALTGLEYLDLSSNKLQKVPTDALKLIPRLLDLFLGGNEIDSITKGAFQGLTHLRSLDLSHSFKLEKLSPDSFLGLENLGVLNISRCTGLYLVGKDALAHLSNLQHLSFHSSGVATIVESSFGQPGSGFAADLLTFDLSGCPLNCDCDAAWLRYRSFDSSNARCHSPKEAHGLPPSAVKDDDVFKCRSASSRSHWLVITIGVAGVFGSIGLFVVVFGIYCCCRRKRRKKEKKAYADGGNKLSGAGDTARDATPFLNQYHPPTEQIHYTVENDFIYFPGRSGTTGYKLEPVTDL